MQEYSEDPADTNLRGLPLYYADFDKELSTASSNGSTITVSPVPDANYNAELHYLYKPTSLVLVLVAVLLGYQQMQEALCYMLL